MPQSKWPRPSTSGLPRTSRKLIARWLLAPCIHDPWNNMARISWTQQGLARLHALVGVCACRGPQGLVVLLSPSHCVDGWCPPHHSNYRTRVEHQTGLATPLCRCWCLVPSHVLIFSAVDRCKERRIEGEEIERGAHADSFINSRPNRREKVPYMLLLFHANSSASSCGFTFPCASDP